MENLFTSNALQSYGQANWEVVNERNFSQAEVGSVLRNEVVVSKSDKVPEGTLSVCFFLNGGIKKYIPLSNRSALQVGDSLNLSTCKLLTLTNGERNILRVQE